MGLGPFQFAWLTLHFEVFMAFGAAEAELSGIVPDETDTMAGIHGPRAEMTGFDSAQ